MTPAVSNWDHQDTAVDAASLRRTMGRFATGVAVVTTGSERDLKGALI